MSRHVTHYETLGVPPSVSAAALREAYLALALQYHPDTGRVPDGKVFSNITAAYAVLKNEKLRAEYDKVIELLLPPCPKCGGDGVTYKYRGFTHRYEVPCTECKGRGRT